jgi:hypothetical protein
MFHKKNLINVVCLCVKKINSARQRINIWTNIYNNRIGNKRILFLKQSVGNQSVLLVLYEVEIGEVGDFSKMAKIPEEINTPFPDLG